MYCDVVGSIEVYKDPGHSIPIGTARCIGWDAAGSAVWRLATQEDELEGPCVIVDREFLSTRPDWRNLYRSDSHRDYDRSGRASLPAAGRRRGTGWSRRTQSELQTSIS
jgi:hypothetical protein